MSKQRAFSAGIWSGLDVVLRQGVQFVVSIILARLLAPEDFGVIALLSFFTSLSLMFVQGGLSLALVQRQETSIEEESAIFWWNLLASGIFSFLLVAAGPLLASFYDNEVLRPLTWVAAAQIMGSALSAVQSALLTRRLEFRQLTTAGIISSLLGGAAGVGMAWAGAGVWALAWQMVVLAVANTILLWMVSDWRPILHAKLATIRHLVGFGGWVSLGSVLDVLYTQGFALIIGKAYGVRELGFYNRAASTQLLPTTAISTIIGRIVLPLFSSRADDSDALRRGLRAAIGMTMLLNLPVMTGLAILSADVIVVLFGARWLPAAPILSVLAAAGLLYPLHYINLQAVLAQGDPRTFIRNELAKKTVGVVCVIIGSMFGIMGVAWSQLVLSVLALGINAQPARATLGYGPLRQVSDLWTLILATAVMGASIILLRSEVSLAPLPALLLCVAVGAAVYFISAWLLRSPALLEATQLVSETPVGRRLLARGRPSA